MTVFEANAKAILSRHPSFPPSVLEPPGKEGEGVITLAPTPSGLPTAMLGGTYIHSRYDPRKEAAAQIASDAGGQPTACLILGFGLGYAAEELARRFPSAEIVVVEPDPAFFRAALAARDLSGLFSSPRLRLLVAEKPEKLSSVLEDLPLAALRIIKLRAETGKNPEYFDAAEQIAHAFLLRKDINVNTLNRFGRLWVRNLASNIRAFLDSPGVALFAGLFEGIPALLLAGGPSFDTVKPHLAALSQRMLVVAVETPLRPCLEAGVSPDFVVMVDPQYWATRYLDWTDSYDGFVVAEPSTHPRTFRSAGRRFIFASSLFPLGARLESLIGEKGKLGAGGSVSTSAWDLCRLLGAGPVYTAGLDLGFPGRRTHCAGAFFEERWFTLHSRLSPAEDRSFRYLREIGVFPMPSNDGGRTLTDRRMLLYKWWFESQLAGARQKTSSLAERAVSIEGMPLAPREEALSLPVVRGEIDARMTKARLIADAFGRDRAAALEALDGALSDILDGLAKLEALARRGISEVRALSRAVASGANRAPFIARLDGIDKRILELSSRDIVGFLIQPLIHRIVDSAPASHPEASVLEASEHIYRGILDSARFHAATLGVARAKLRG